MICSVYSISSRYFDNFHSRSDRFACSARLIQSCACCLIALLLPAVLWGQTNDVDQKGVPSDGVFHQGDIDTVNLQNGNLHISIPIASVKQRGGSTVTWMLEYDTQAWLKQWIPYTNCSPTCNPTGYYVAEANPNVTSGWRVTSSLGWEVTFLNTVVTCTLASPTYSYNQYTNWAVVDPHGTSHPLPLREEVGTGTPCLGQTLSGPTLDGSGLTYNISTGVLRSKDGTILQNGGATDANGNEMTSGLDTLDRKLVTTTTGPTVTYTTPLGSQIKGPQYTRYSVLNSNGAQEVYEVDYQAIDETTDICAQTVGLGGNQNCTDDTGPFLVDQQLLLPNGKAYVFTYSNGTPGALSRVDLPTGASIGYTYSDYYQLQFGTHGTEPSSSGGLSVATRTVTVDGVANQWSYSVTDGTSTITDPLGNKQTHTFSQVSAGTTSDGPEESANRYETQVVYQDSSGKTLKTVTQAYAGNADYANNTVINVLPISKTVTLDNGMQSQKQTDYETFTFTCALCDTDAGQGIGVATRLNPTEIRQYDYGTGKPGALLKRTDFTYLHTGSTTYKNLNMVDKVTSITTYDGSGNEVAETVNEFDIYNHPNQAMVASGAIRHGANYGTSYTTRGNITATSRWLNTTGALLASTFQYDDAGNMLSVVDPNGYRTSYSYADSWQGTACVPSGSSAAYRTTITNAKGQSSAIKYLACTGNTYSTTDPNGAITGAATTYAYDSFDRVAQVSLPDGGSKTFCYSDDKSGSCYSATALFSTETDAINATTNLIRTTDYDGLGRIMQTQLNTDPSNVDFVDTQYDGDGRVLKVSNPYRSGDTIYWTTQLYDGIGRSAGVTNQDGSSTSITYTGNTSWSYDELGHQRKSQTDALGRLTFVWEAPTNFNFETDYQYDALGNLIHVTQHGASGDTARTRSFVFDSLSRLQSTTNPETGTTGYHYDNDGNLISKTDARSVVTTYSYDVLNRLVAKSYSDGTTPAACYQYDTPVSSVTDTNPIGALTLEWTQAGSCPGSSPPQTAVPTGSITSTVFFSHDPMGRTQGERQYTRASLAKGTYYAAAYTYDLTGNLVTSTSGGGPTLTTYIDGAGRVGCVNSSWSPNSLPSSTPWPLFTAQTGQIASCPVSLSAVPYTAAGGLQNAAYGYSGMIVNRVFDNRLRPTSENDAGNAPSSPTNASTTITITGAEQVH